ncbi:DUF3800 domain-containing protein [Bradyrhizobium erythrophlei]|nr:DUF3800 domain-containing protein [Bradyrhizobium erythrophlei]
MLHARNFLAFIDDSSTPGGESVLAGHIATVEAWEKFKPEWEAMLPFGTLAENGKQHFKMSEMAALPERMERVPWFYRIIEEHVTLSLACRIDLTEYEAALERIRNNAQKLGLQYVNFDRFENPFAYQFRALMDQFHTDRPLLDPELADGKVDFYFDNRMEEGFISATWDDYMSSRPDETKNRYGAKPIFGNDQTFLPLQAADLWAWWVREWYEEDASELPTKMENFDFGTWRGKKRPCLTISYNEDQIVEGLMSTCVLTSD